MKKVVFICLITILLTACGQSNEQTDGNHAANASESSETTNQEETNTKEDSVESTEEDGEEETDSEGSQSNSEQSNEEKESNQDETVAEEEPNSILFNSSGNINQDGQYLIVDDTIYFPNLSDNEYLYKMNLDGSNAVKLTDYPATNLHLYDDWIYYTPIQPSVDENGEQIIIPSLNRMKLDGSETEVVMDEPMGTVFASGDKLYTVVYPGDVLQFDLKEQSVEKLPYQALTMSVYEDTIVYYNHDGYHLGDVNGETNKPLFTTSYGDYVVEGDYLYYSIMDGESGLYRYSLTDGEEVHIIPEGVTFFNVKDDYIYYSASGAEVERSFYRVNQDGAEKHDYQTIIQSPHIFDDYIIGYFARQGVMWYTLIDLVTNEVKEI